MQGSELQLCNGITRPVCRNKQHDQYRVISTMSVINYGDGTTKFIRNSSRGSVFRIGGRVLIRAVTL